MLLYPLLQEYLIENGKLPLPEKGLLTIDEEPAYIKAYGNTLIAPTSNILFVPLEIPEPEIKNLISFLSKKLNVSNEQAKDLLSRENIGEAFVGKSGILINWPPANGNKGNNDHQTNGSQIHASNNYLPSFTVEKIMRQPVSEPVIPLAATAPEIIINEEVYQNEEIVTKDYWWVWALVIFLVSILLIVFRHA